MVGAEDNDDTARNCIRSRYCENKRPRRRREVNDAVTIINTIIITMVGELTSKDNNRICNNNLYRATIAGGSKQAQSRRDKSYLNEPLWRAESTD